MRHPEQREVAPLAEVGGIAAADLHLLGGARADATRVRSGADRAVVEGRFTTADLDEKAAAQIDEMLDASGAERDEDGSIIALRSIEARKSLAGITVATTQSLKFSGEKVTK